MVVSVFAARLFQLQGVDAQAYVAKARAEGVVTAPLPADRGEITDRNGEPLAESVDGLMLVADPTLTSKHAAALAEIVARRLDVDYFDTLTRLRKPDTHFQYVARRVPAAKARGVVAAAQARGFEGLDTRRDPVRDYPAHDVAANLVGFMNAEGDPGEGAELMFDHLLSGKDGSTTYEVGGGNRIPLGDNSVVQPQRGHDLHLTIDRDVQWYAQRVVRSAVQTSGSSSGAAVVMDSRTGQLLALADYPTFDANDPTGSPERDLGSRALRDVYEPGSVEKVLTMSSLLDAGKVTPQTRVTVPPELRRGDRVIHDWFPHGKLHLTLTGVIAKSSNIGTVLAATQFQHVELWRYLRKFGLGQRTGIGVHGESPGMLADWHNWSQINQDTIAFGQGLSVNAVQMTAAVNAIANRGVYVSPSLVKGEARTSTGELVGSDTATQHRVVSQRAARLTAQMMESVPNPETGTAPKAAIEGYRVAGKTGTAQRVGKRCGCYDGTFTVSFAGFAPADDPRFTVYVVAQDPKNGGGGGSIGGPVFHKIMSYLLQKYAVPPTGTKAPTPKIEW
ncbi:MAG: penicillin-binding protein 2 [Nocardioidaceae bacterium]|nr:penicillin-binding protein 2 [Nocardioidaceae bacterium]NUS52874.1 penicillin-binding protein 2 [Nocardioidaceae bacterium]